MIAGATFQIAEEEVYSSRAVERAILEVRATVPRTFGQPDLLGLLCGPINLDRLLDRNSAIRRTVNHEEWSRRQLRHISHRLDISTLVAT